MDSTQLSQDELDQEQAADLPERDALSVIQPVNQIIDTNFMANGVTTEASATQDAPITQTGS
jgi:hypothetical protein